MASNDQVILDKILEQKKDGIAENMSEADFFELFSAEQILKDYDLSYDEIVSGFVSGGGDGGIDSVYLFVNGELIREDTDLDVFKKDITLEVVFIQSKRSESFSGAAVIHLTNSAEHLLDLSRPLSNFSKLYNKDILDAAQRIRATYTALAERFPKLRFRYFYATRGLEIHPNVQNKAEELKEKIHQLFSDCDVTFEFLGANKLLELARRGPKTSFTINLAETPISSTGAVSFIALVKLRDYYKFVTDDDGKLRRNIFEANVRDYQGEIQVNSEIQATLRGEKKEDFWWLNNGVTIVASNAVQSGKTITIEDPNVVNGLQTSTEIYKYFSETNTEGDQRHLQVKIVVPKEGESRDRIVKATNRQTSIPPSSLRATEKIHRDIEVYLKPHKLYYDRRKNYYKNEGKPIDQIISIGQMAQAVMAIVLGRPNDARARPSSLLNDEKNYEAVFSENYPVDTYRICGKWLKKVESFLKSDAVELGARDRNNLRFYVAMYAAMCSTGKSFVDVSSIETLNPDKLNDETLLKVFEDVVAEYEILGGDDQVAKGTELKRRLIAKFEGR